MATRGDLNLATSGDFHMATDKGRAGWCQTEHEGPGLRDPAPRLQIRRLSH